MPETGDMKKVIPIARDPAKAETNKIKFRWNLKLIRELVPPQITV